MTMRASRSAEGSISGDRLRHCGRRRPLRRKRMRHSESRGSASLELVILVPALTALVLFVMWAAEGGRASLIADLAAEEAATAAAAACELDDPECLDSVAGEVLASRPGLAELCANGPEPSSLVETNTDDGFAVRAGDAVSVGVLCRSEGSVAPVRGFTPTVNFYGQATHVVAGPERNVTLDAPQAVIEGDEIEFTIQVTPPPTTSLTLNLSLTQEGGFVVEKDDTTKVVNDLGSIVKDLPICTIEAALADGTANSDSETGTPDSGTEIPVDEGENSIGGADPASCSGGDSVITWKNPSVIKNSNADDSWQVKFSLNTQGDDVVEPDGEVTATVTVPDGSDYEAGRQATAKVTIISDDVPAVTIKAVSDDVTEGDTPAEAVFTLEVPAGQTPVTDTPIKIMVEETGSQLDDGDTGEQTVTLKAGQNKATHRITIPNDNDVELISTVTVTIQPDDGCSVSTSTTDPPDCPPPSTLTCPPDSTSGPRCRYDVATPSEASLTVKDDDVPGVTIKAGSDVTEGDPGDTPAEAVFTLEVPAGQAPVTDAAIKIMVSESHNQLAAGDTGEKTVTLKAGELEATHTITIPNDNKVEGRSEVTVTIIDGTDDYEIGNPKEASLTVEDDDVPTVTLKAGSDFVTEGNDAEFTITADDAPLNDITVNLSVEETRSMLEAGATGAGKTVTLSAGDTEATYPIPTDDDDVVEKPSEVTVTIQRGEGYNVGAPGKASLTVEDNDVPTVTIEAGSDVEEGEDAVFTITADQEPLEPITVHLSVEETESMLQAGATGAKTVMLTASKTTTTHLIQTDDDEVVEDSSKVTVAVTPDEKYNPADTPSDSLGIRDNDSPAVSVSAGPEITEGEDAVFTVRAHQAPLELLLVRVDIEEASSDFVAYAHGGIRIVEIAAGEKTGELKVPTIDDDVVEGSGEITATAVAILGDKRDYTVVEPTTASIIVNDNEPVVTITAPADPIIEGKAPVFTLHADPAPKSAVTVPVTVTQDGDFLAPSAIRTYHVTINPKSKTNTLIAGSASGALHLPRTVDDDVTEDAGTVTASIAGQSSTSYTVGEPDTATVAVADNDMTVEVTAVKPEVDEGEPAVFTVEASAAPTEALTVNVDISQAGDFVDRRQTGARKVTIAAGSTTSPEIRVPTKGNNLDQDDGEVTATVTTGTDYTPGTDSSASVIIKDDDSVLRGLAKRRNTFIRCLLNRDLGNRITYLGNRISESSSQEFCTYPMGYFREDLDVMIYFGDPNSAIVHSHLDENYLQKGIPLATPAASCAEPGADVIIARDTIPPTVFGDAPAGTGDALIAPGAIHTVYSTADSDIHIDFKIRVCDDNESEGPEVFALVVDWRAASEPGRRRTDIEVLTIIRSD